ncbi:MAG: histidine phosphatase family protein [Asgard group archaeon]|nr:histidine phosphatase family protein [Asgard group archaeon]
MKIYLVRHGETEYNRKKLLMGQKDIPLNEKGVKQAEKLAKYMKNKVLTAIYSSDLSRAFKTAEIIAEEVDLPVIRVQEFKEHSLGNLDGTEWTEEMEIMTREEFEVWMYDEGAEDMDEFYNRVWKKFLEIVENHPKDENLLLVMHGGCTRVIIKQILNATEDLFASLSQYNACINIIKYNEKRVRFKFIIEKINECHHLEEHMTHS